MKPLNGLTVLDISRVLAGPLCAQTLGDLGAAVIKIETLNGGDESRTWPPFHQGMATAFCSANRNKKSIALDLKNPTGRAIFHKMVQSADIVIESGATGVSERLQVDFETLRVLNPRLIYCAISGYGRTGPLKDLRGYDMILQAYSGMMSITGDPGGAPLRVPYSPIDQTTGHHAAMGVLAAVIGRGQTGKGALVEVSLLETAVSFLGYLLQAYQCNGELPEKCGSRHAGIAPYQAFEAADKTVLIAVANDKLWQAFCKVFEVPHLGQDPRFATNKDRVAHIDLLARLVQETVGDLPAAEVLRRLNDAGVPSAPVNTLADILQDEQIRARGLLQPIAASGPLAGISAALMPILFDGQRPDAGLQPPALGQHTASILSDLGYTSAEIANLTTQGVIATLDDYAVGASD